MTRAVLSIGSNLGDRVHQLQIAVDAFAPWLVAASGLYRTPPWGPVEQPDFYNAVLIVDDPDASPRDWLERAWAAEAQAGRTREVHWGARTLDVDVIDVDGIVTTDDTLTLPHPFAHERAFVLVPWLEVDPDAILPKHGDVRALLAALPPDDVASVVALGPLPAVR